MKKYFVYIVKCSDGSLYTGYCVNNVERRVREHNTGLLGAKYTRTRRPVELVYWREHGSRGEAMREEYRIKGLSRWEKMKLVDGV